MEKKLVAAATAAAQEATLNERARCLWVLDQIVEETRRAMAKKVLIESERHAIAVKIQLALAIVAGQARDRERPQTTEGEGPCRSLSHRCLTGGSTSSATAR
jgi:acyl-CoA reductase-like NAD-dependent aldehyde dehydrogenase